MNILVFGGTGWVGHHIVRQFARDGHDVTVCSRGKKNTFSDEMPDGIRTLQADKSSDADVARVFQTPYDVVIDSVPTVESIDNVARNARGLKHYLHCSSTGGYAPLTRVPGDETMPYDEFMGGWKHKGVVDAMVLDLHHRSGFPATVIRPSYITGPGMLPLDNLGGRREDFIPDILDGKPLDLPGDGQALLHPIHVVDLARGFLLAAQRPGVSIGQIYNFCLDKAVPIQRYIRLNAAALDREAKINLMSVEGMLEKYRPDVHEVGLRFFATHMCYDITKAKTQLGYRPHVTTEVAVEQTARWAARQLGRV